MRNVNFSTRARGAKSGSFSASRSPPKTQQRTSQRLALTKKIRYSHPISPKQRSTEPDSPSQIKPRTSGGGRGDSTDLVVEGEALAERRLGLLDVAVVDLGLRRARRGGAGVRLLRQRRLPLHRGRGGRRPLPGGARLAPAVPLRRRRRRHRWLRCCRCRCLTAADASA